MSKLVPKKWVSKRMETKKKPNDNDRQSNVPQNNVPQNNVPQNNVPQNNEPQNNEQQNIEFKNMLDIIDQKNNNPHNYRRNNDQRNNYRRKNDQPNNDRRNNDRRNNDRRNNDRQNNDRRFTNRQSDNIDKSKLAVIKISNLPDDISLSELNELIQPWGSIGKINIGKSHFKTAYIDFYNKAEAEYFVEALDKTPFDYLIMKVEILQKEVLC